MKFGDIKEQTELYSKLIPNPFSCVYESDVHVNEHVYTQWKAFNDIPCNTEDLS